MIIKKILIDNYKSFQHPTEIVFPQVTKDRNIFLIGGMNGSGKTSLLEAVSICLYGAKKEFIYKRINRNEFQKNNFQVTFELELETDELDILKIKRSYSCIDTDNPKPNNIEEKLTIIKNGDLISLKNKDIWNDYIVSKFPESITQFFFFDGEKIQEVASDDHFEIRLRSSLEAALGIKFLSQLSNDIIKVKLNERESFSEITDDDIKLKENNLKILKQKNRKLEENKNLNQNDLEEFEQEHKVIKKRFQLLFNQDPEKKNEERTREQRRIQESTRLIQIDSEIKNITESLLPLAMSGALFEKIKEQMEIESKTLNNLSIKDSANYIVDIAIDSLYNPSIILDKPLSNEQKQEFAERLKKAISSKPGSNGKKILDLSQIEAAQVSLTIKNIEQSDIHRLSSLIEEKIELDQSIRELKNDVYDNMNPNDSNLFTQLQDDLDSLSTQIGRKKEELNALVEKIIDIDTEIQKEEKDISFLYDKYSISQEKSDFISECNKLSEMLNEYVVALRKNKVKLLRDKTLEMYKLLSSKGDLISDIDINELTYEVIIKGTDNIEIKKSGLSAGEKEVFAISLLWGLAQTSKIDLPIIIDTPLSRLDSSHRDSIVHNYFPNSGKQVVILSTDTEVDQKYYLELEKYLAGSGTLFFDKNKQKTIYKEKYFRNN